MRATRRGLGAGSELLRPPVRPLEQRASAAGSQATLIVKRRARPARVPNPAQLSEHSLHAGYDSAGPAAAGVEEGVQLRNAAPAAKSAPD